MSVLLSLSAGDYTALAGALVLVMAGFFAGVVSVINAIKGTNQKLDSAATRREQIGTATVDPSATQLPPKETP